MGFFKKIFKGVKKVFKKIGGAIKRTFKKIGKFMNKIGIVGQIALSFLLPGVGALIGKAAGAMMASSSAIVSGAGSFLNAAVNIGAKAGSLVKSVSDGVLKVVGKTVGTAINKIPGAGDFLYKMTSGKIDITQMKNFTGPGGIMDTASKAITDVAAKGRDLFSVDTLTEPNKFISKDISASASDMEKALEGDSVAFENKKYAPQQATVTDVVPDPNKYDIPLANRPDSAIPDAFPGYGRTPTVESFDVTKGELYSVPDQPPGGSLLAPDQSPLKIDTTVTKPTVDPSIDIQIAPPAPQQPTSLTDKFLGTEVGQKAQSKATEMAGKLTKSNVARALTETGMAGDTYTGGTYAVADIDPEAEQYAVNQTSLGAEGTRRTIQRMEVTGFRGTDPNLVYQPQSSWANNLAGLLQGQPVGSVG